MDLVLEEAPEPGTSLLSHGVVLHVVLGDKLVEQMQILSRSIQHLEETGDNPLVLLELIAHRTPSVHGMEIRAAVQGARKSAVAAGVATALFSAMAPTF